MYPVPRYSDQVFAEWIAELSATLDRPRETLLSEGGLRVADFRDSLKITLMDGSYAVFKYAFAIVSEEKRAIAVFTEHCGYLVFPHHDATIEICTTG